MDLFFGTTPNTQHLPTTQQLLNEARPTDGMLAQNVQFEDPLRSFGEDVSVDEAYIRAFGAILITESPCTIYVRDNDTSSSIGFNYSQLDTLKWLQEQWMLQHETGTNQTVTTGSITEGPGREIIGTVVRIEDQEAAFRASIECVEGGR